MKTHPHPTRIRVSGLTFKLFASLFLGLALCSAPAADIRSGMVSYWPLDSITGDTTPDVAFTNTMNVFGAPVVSPGKFGNAFTFANHVYLTNLHEANAYPSSGLPIYSAGAYTICMWVKGPPQTGKYLYTEANLTNNNPLLLLQTGQVAANNAKFNVNIRTDGNTTILNHVVSTKVVFDDTWHHIAWVDDNGNARLYVDGELDPTNFNYSRAGTFTFQTSAIGTLVRTNISGTAVFNGQIDDVAIWERPLSQAEVQSVMAGIPTPIPPLPPSLHVEPVSMTRQLGDWALFSTRAYANRPHNTFTYQWYKNGALIPGATGRTYQTDHLTPVNSGDYYSVTVANGVGSPVSSSNAVITVLADPPAIVTSGLVNYWPLDIVNDDNGNLTTPDLYSRADMVLTNEMTMGNLVSGYIGNSLLFDGQTNIAYRASGVPISANPSYSISMWVKGDYAFQNDRRVFSEGSPTNNNPLMTIGTRSDSAGPSAQIMVRSDAGTSLVGGRRSTAPVFDDMWHHIVWTDVNGQGRLYVDGVLDYTDFTYNPATRIVSQTSLGGVMRGTATGNFFFGQIDEVGTWNRALTFSEVQEIFANGIPTPVAEIPPEIVSQPVSRTNNTWVQQDVTFSVAVSGTSPKLQWFKNGVEISTTLNPSAGTTTLQLQNIQLSDNGFYFLVASNSAGMATSETVQLLAQTFTPKTVGEVLRIDVGSDAVANVQPGFDEFTLGANGNSFGSVGVTISPIGSISFAARNRPTDSTLFITDAPPELTQASVYNDFIFANSSTVDMGMRVLIERLAPNTPYGVTFWSYDRASTGNPRVSNWTETSSGTEIPVALGYTMEGSVAPTNDFQYTFGGLFTSSPQGRLQFEGRVVSGGVAVFFNGLRLVARPTGTSLKLLDVVEGNMIVQVEGDYEGQPVSLQQSSTLVPGVWSPAAGATQIDVNGPALIFQVPAGGGSSMFYRAVSNPTW
jgi:hypothetical protein